MDSGQEIFDSLNVTLKDGKIDGLQPDGWNCIDFVKQGDALLLAAAMANEIVTTVLKEREAIQPTPISGSLQSAEP
tara:strand:+ start:329 stop:556 length:228 start_codon:yes stop_codon:yes gene_type:complete